jgi:hypothetical protein
MIDPSAENAHNERSAPTKKTQNTSWLSKRVNIKKKKIGRSAKAVVESLMMKILPRPSNSAEKRKNYGGGN